MAGIAGDLFLKLYLVILVSISYFVLLLKTKICDL